MWRIERATLTTATLFVDPAGRFSRDESDAIEDEGRRMLRLLEPAREAIDVRFVALDA